MREKGTWIYIVASFMFLGRMGYLRVAKYLVLGSWMTDLYRSEVVDCRFRN